MNRYVKIKHNGKIFPQYYLYVDKRHQWTAEQIVSENAKAVEIAKMAFLNHGEPLIPVDDLSLVLSQKAAYLNPVNDSVLLVNEGGSFMTLLPDMEIVEEVSSQYYPIEEGAAIACENDPFITGYGGLGHVFLRLAKLGGADSFHYMYNFRNRTEAEVIDAFKKTPAIVFCSSHTEADWWELMLRCIIKSGTKAKVIGRKPSSNWSKEPLMRYEKCVEMANKFGIEIISA